jgi:hypothetical protein
MSDLKKVPDQVADALGGATKGSIEFAAETTEDVVDIAVSTTKKAVDGVVDAGKSVVDFFKGLFS